MYLGRFHLTCTCTGNKIISDWARKAFSSDVCGDLDLATCSKYVTACDLETLNSFSSGLRFATLDYVTSVQLDRLRSMINAASRLVCPAWKKINRIKQQKIDALTRGRRDHVSNICLLWRRTLTHDLDLQTHMYICVRNI